MKNKLLLTTALTGGLIAASSAIAQTTVTGSLDLHYRALSFSGQGGAGVGLNTSRQGMGRETQLNIQNKGKLNNGMDYAAGFSLEFDGGQQACSAGMNSCTDLNEAASVSNENVYVDFIAGTTTLTFGLDHVQNSTRHSAPMVRNILDDMPALSVRATDQIGAKTKEFAYFGIVQQIPGTGISLSAIKAPAGNYGQSDQAVNTASERNASYEIGFQGVNVGGVAGLNAHAFTNKEKVSAAQGNDLKGTTYGIGYTMGQFGLGADVHKTNRSTSTLTTESNMKATTIAATYAVTKEITLGAIYMRNSIDAVAETEKSKTIQVGYNLGPVAIIGHYDIIDGIGGSAAASAEAKQAGVRISTSF
jgi:predicted porin